MQVAKVTYITAEPNHILLPILGQRHLVKSLWKLIGFEFAMTQVFLQPFPESYQSGCHSQPLHEVESTE
jgi:hypothetical protein